MQRITISVSDEVGAWLRSRAERTDRSISYVAGHLIEGAMPRGPDESRLSHVKEEPDPHATTTAPTPLIPVEGKRSYEPDLRGKKS